MSVQILLISVFLANYCRFYKICARACADLLGGWEDQPSNNALWALIDAPTLVFTRPLQLVCTCRITNACAPCLYLCLWCMRMDYIACRFACMIVHVYTCIPFSLHRIARACITYSYKEICNYVFSVVVSCGPAPDAPANGQRSVSSTTFQSTVTYTCKQGYTLQGDKNRTCMANGHWSGRAPTCNRKLLAIRCSTIDIHRDQQSIRAMILQCDDNWGVHLDSIGTELTSSK